MLAYIPFLRASSSNRSEGANCSAPALPTRRLADTGSKKKFRIFQQVSSQACCRTDWQPAALQPAVLCMIMLFTIAVIIVIQVLRHYTAADQGLTFVPAADGTFPAFTIFGYLYFPTILAVIFSMFWAWVDLDVKRLEPFFQLAGRNGALLSDSLSLSYPFDYVALVPLKAARRRHWPVLISGTITVLIFWAITPLQNSMITTKQVVRSIETNINTTSNLSRISDAFSSQIDTSLLQVAWATLWYNQSLPAFATNESAFAPLDLTRLSTDALQGANVTAPSIRYWTTLNCSAATYRTAPAGNTSSDYFGAVKGDGCELDLSGMERNDARPAEGQGLYCGQTGAAGTCTFVELGRGCGNDEHTIMLGWISYNHTSTFDMTAQFCDVRYWQQDGDVTVSIDDGSYQQFLPRRDPIELAPSLFNTVEFEALISSGVNKNGARANMNNTLSDSTGNATSISQLETWAHYADTLGRKSEMTSPMYAFAYGLMQTDYVDFAQMMDPVTLARCFERAHQFLFALTMSNVLLQLETDAMVTGQTYVLSQTVYLVDPLAWIVQAFLGLVTLLAATLLFFSWNRPTSLDANPDSLDKIATLLEPDSTTAVAVSCLQGAPSQAVLLNQDARFQLTREEKIYGSRIQLVDNDDNWNAPPSRPCEDKPEDGHFPFHLEPLCGLLVVAVLAAAIALLACLQKYSLKNNGLPVPSENAVVQQLVLNYVPIIFATFLEPFWTLLNRSLCLLQPFIELKMLHAQASRSLQTRYSSLPPQIVFLRALRNKHFLLAALCAVAISSNIIAVTLGALFNTSQITTLASIKTTATSQALFNDPSSVGLLGFSTQAKGAADPELDLMDTDFQDHYYIAQSNITRGTSLPPWTVKDFFFMPQTFDTTGSAQFTTTTRGFGVRTECRDLAHDLETGDATFSMSPGGNTKPFNGYDTPTVLTIDTKDGKINCSTPVNNKNEMAYSFINGTAAFEGFSVLMAPNDTRWDINNSTYVTAVSPCSDMFAVNYGRTSNATTLDPTEAYDADASAPRPTNPTNDPNFGGNGPCHSTDCGPAHKRFTFTPHVFPLNITSLTNLVCRTYLTTSTFNVTVSPLGTVLSYQNLSSTTEDPAAFFQSDDDMHELILRMNVMATANAEEGSTAGRYTRVRTVLHNTTVGRQWLPYLMMMAANNGSTLDPFQPAPPPDVLIPMISDLSSLLGSIMLSLYQHRLFPLPNAASGPQNATTFAPGVATYWVTEDRVFLDPTMYAMTMTLLAIHLVAAIIFYCTIPRDVITRLPTTLADQLGFFEGSTLIEERDWDPKWKYGYGRFVGADGRPRIGIERVPLVQPLDINRKVSWLQAWRRS